ncbi:hypothetical protein [Candidatus Korobacter versatilis]|uniref:hypothetical protein n=1 Tax=Candidatus Korobacter versatilis TaxID=658062 RepID=UPI000308B2A4|nr:hypothetical protein [Candidatus Koribacter versatilis]
MFETVAQVDSSSFGWPVFFAFLAGLGYIIAVGVLFGSVERIEMILWAALPISQFLYIGPLIYRAKKNGYRRAMHGWIVGAAVAALVFMPCWGLAFSTSLEKIK